MAVSFRDSKSESKCYFVTTSCYKHIPLIALSKGYNHVANSVNNYTTKYDADVLAYVIMPNHLHLLLYFKQEVRLSNLMRDIKKQSSFKIRNELQHTSPYIIPRLVFEDHNQVYKVWEDGFYDFHVFTADMILQKLNYIHNNPLQEKWQLSKTAEDYRYSSAGFYRFNTEGLIKTEVFTKYFDVPVAKK
jgi:putative transposase